MREWLKKLRTDKGMTQKQMAEKIGISDPYYALIESGNRQKKMDIDLIAKIAKATNQSVTTITKLELMWQGFYRR